ncbi:Peroxidase [Pseudolycoriella hygida]|uniref:Peroxidase n=1 Tax=Pseudolycoriella hygida TaxID=35572 RepID=A0A9Q0MSX3_9DIPT|nr:Peroxidase [Pseudolycoriella hygida]
MCPNVVIRYGRLISPKYGDGVSSPTVSLTGEELPNARLVSLLVFGERDVPDPQYTLFNMQWGQIMTHDMSMLAGSTQSTKHATRCCTDDGKLVSKSEAHKTCYPILIPKNDPAFSQVQIDCLNFVRTLTDQDQNCDNSHIQAEQLTVVTAFMDLSLVYGNSEQQNQPIRAFQGGRMVVVERDGYEWPPQASNATSSCEAQTRDEICYLTGDVRTNQNPGLAILQIILLREHNRIADVLQHLNPHWDDELTFQEARRINIAQYQHISYYEWLPIFLGTENMLKNRLIYKTKPGSYVNDYDPTIDPSVLNSHATAAFRYFHSQIEGRLDLISEIRSSTGALRLSDWFNRPAIIEANDNYDSLTRGHATQPEELTDINFDAEIKHFLFRMNRPFGQDLRAIDIQRNRDHGLASYNDYREFCGLRRAHDWNDFLDLISPESVAQLQSLYSTIEDVDLTVGGSLEAHVEGALAGPTFLCILTEQFFRTRVGDRYFYEEGEKDVAFSRGQLSEIRKASIARLICDNSNHIQTIQPSAFLRVSKTNELTSCSNIPIVDLSQWKDLSVPNIQYHHYKDYGLKK